MGKRKPSNSESRGAGKPLSLEDSEWPIEIGKLMKTPTFRPTEEEFADFYAYAQKLDRLVGHVGVCKVIPPVGWKPRAHDVYNLKDSTEALEEAVTVKKPIKQNALGGKGLYLNLHEEKRSMTLKAFKKATQEKAFQPPVDVTSESLRDEDLELLERKFWKNVLFQPPMYGADVPAPQGFRKDGREGLFDPEVCGSWDLAKLPSLLNFGLKKKVPGVNTSFIYVGMYRAAFAWHCEDMDLHSINYLHWGAPKTWYTVPATHGSKLEELARKHFPVQAAECSEFLRHKTNMIEPGLLLKAGIPLTRTVQKAGEFIINFPGAYHSGFNNGYNCAESCNFATEYWIPFGVQAKPCSCSSKQNSVRIDVDAILNKVKDVKVKGEQWVQCESCSKWRLLPPFMMHLLKEDDPFTCNLIQGMTCGKKETAAWGDDGQWEMDGKVQLGLDPGKEQWVLCEQCSTASVTGSALIFPYPLSKLLYGRAGLGIGGSGVRGLGQVELTRACGTEKWRRIPSGVTLDADAVFVCSVLEGWNCEKEEEQWEEAEDGQGWQIMDMDERRSKYGEWTAADEDKLRIKFVKEELAAYGVGEARVAECGDDRAQLEALLGKTAQEVAESWQDLTSRWPGLAPPVREEAAGNLRSSPARSSAASVAQRLWFMDVEAEEAREHGRKKREQEKRKRKMEEVRAEEARAVQEYTEEIQSALKAAHPPFRSGSMSPSRANSPAPMVPFERSCASPIPRCASPMRQGSPMPPSTKRLRFHRQLITVVCFGSAHVERAWCKDDKTFLQLQKLLSPSSREVTTIHLPAPRASGDPPALQMQSHHHGPYTLATPSVSSILGQPPSHAPPVLGPGAAGAFRSLGVPLFVRAVLSGGREEALLMEYAGKLEEARGSGCPAPFAVLLSGTEVAVGSWQEEGEEAAARGRGDGLLARVAMKRVVSVLEGALHKVKAGGIDAAHSVPAVKLEAEAAGSIAAGTEAVVKREDGVAAAPRPHDAGAGLPDADLLHGMRGWGAAQDMVTERFWQRCARGDSVEVAGHGEGSDSRRVIVVHAPALPPRSPQAKPSPLPTPASLAAASLTPPTLPPPAGAASRCGSLGHGLAHTPMLQPAPAFSLSPSAGSGMGLFGCLPPSSALHQMHAQQPLPAKYLPHPPTAAPQPASR